MKKSNLELLRAFLQEEAGESVETLGVKIEASSSHKGKISRVTSEELDEVLNGVNEKQILAINADDLDEDTIALLDLVSGGEFSKMHQEALREMEAEEDEEDEEETKEEYAIRMMELCDDLVTLLNKHKKTCIADLVTAVSTISMGLAVDEVDKPDKYVQHIDNISDNIIISLIDQATKLELAGPADLLTSLLHASRTVVNNLDDITRAMKVAAMRDNFFADEEETRKVQKRQKSNNKKVEHTEFSYSKFIQ